MYDIDDSRMPLRLGSALRVPSYAYRNWGITGGDAELRSLSDEAYRIEWEAGSPRQMQYVTDAIVRAGYADFPQMLRNANAAAISKLAKLTEGKLRILDIGAGKSTVAIFDRLDSNDKDRVELTLLEPSAERLEAAASDLEKRGLARNKGYVALQGRDLDIPWLIEPASMHIASYVAALHHHAYYDRPLQNVCAALAEHGSLVVSDWHNPMWEHPNRVYKFLQTLEWDTKEKDLRAFVQQFPNASNGTLFAGSRNESQAMRQIQHFWSGWMEVRKEAAERGELDPRDDILVLEGHRPFASQNREMARAGFMLKEKRQLLDGSELLMLGLYEKVCLGE